ncbi:MAG: efflux RND transporter permease subunit, partial [Flavobacteriaceae bacterium]|nr:efflux RND transporter permease subunit [Flavobacteriaceae bacterium]
MKLDKQFSLSSWAIDNRSTVYVLIVILLVGGVVAYRSMPKENFPETNVPTVYVSTVNPGNSAEDVEKFITEPLEDEISNISGVDKINSTSLQDFSSIEIKFEDDVDPEVAKQKVKDKIDAVKAKADWPKMDGGAKVSPQALDLNLSEMIPIMNINLSGNYPTQKLKKYGEILQDRIEELSEVKEVKIRGVEDMEVEVAVDIYKMMGASVTIDDIVRAIQRENVTISGGNIIANGQRRNIRVIGEIQQPKDLENIIVKSNGGVVYLRDVADVNFRAKDKTTYAREYGMPVVMLDVKKKSGKNQLAAADKIYKIVEDAKQHLLPKDISLTVTSDSSVRTKAQVDDMVNNIIFGILLVVGVLMFFLGAKNALFVGVAIPLSMLCSLLLLSMFGITLNSMVLFGLVMGLGMLVDNGIVVVENVHRLLAEGMSPKDAAKQGVGEIAWPIIASTATTVAAFAPLGFWPGMIGKFMMYLPITLSVVLGSSLFVALVINAMLTSRFMTAEDKDLPKKKLFLYTGILIGVGVLFAILGLSAGRGTLTAFGNLFIIIGIAMLLQRYVFSHIVNFFQRVFLPRLENFYERFLTFALTGRKPYLFFFGTIGFLCLSIALVVIVRPKVSFFPANEPNQANVYIEYPEGTDIEKTNKLTKEIEQKVIDIMKPYEQKMPDGTTYNYMAESIIAQVGQGAGNPQVDGGSLAEMPNKGKVSVLFREYKYRKGVKSSA